MAARTATKERKRTRTQSTVARQAASSREARQRRRAQRKRQFAQTWQQIETRLLVYRQWLPTWHWQPQTLRLPGFSGFPASKVVSLLLLLAISVLFYFLLTDPAFFVYRENVAFENLNYLTADELYEYSALDGWSILWIDPAEIRAQIRSHPYVADAEVAVQWPAQLQISVAEVTPTALWSTEAGVFWLLDDGRALPRRGETAAPVLNIIDPEFAARVPTDNDEVQIQTDLLSAARQLAAQMPGLDSIRYNRTHGLNFGITDTQTWVYWGDGEDFQEKWRALQSALPDINADRTSNQIFSVIAPNRPYFRYYADSP